MYTKFAVILMLAVQVSVSQQVEIPIAVTNTVLDQQKSYVITVAANPKGTVELDTALGELEIPSLPPPAGVFIVYSIPPSKDFMWLSPIDIRPLELGKQHLVEYTIGMTWNAGKINVSWGPIPTLVDSAYIVDVVSDFPNNFIKVKLEPGKSYETINTAITKLKVLVWYNATSLSVQEQTSDIQVYPVPCADEIIVSNAPDGALFDVIDVSGAVISSGQIRQEMQAVSTTQLPSGMYLLRVFNNDGIVYLRKFLRQ
ncbi:MAG: Secretion system C-terminal sorting domain [Bacteroidota bacterium]|jgi:hypothetical protein